MDYIVWRYRAGNWEEVAAFRGADSAAWYSMDPLITHLVSEERASLPPADVSAATARIAAAIDAELGELDLLERERLLAEVYEAIAVRSCAGQEDVKVLA